MSALVFGFEFVGESACAVLAGAAALFGCVGFAFSCCVGIVSLGFDEGVGMVDGAKADGEN